MEQLERTSRPVRVNLPLGFGCSATPPLKEPTSQFVSSSVTVAGTGPADGRGIFDAVCSVWCLIDPQCCSPVSTASIIFIIWTTKVFKLVDCQTVRSTPLSG